MKRSPLRMFAAACIVAFGFGVVALMVVLSVGSKNVTGSDFVEYWVAAQQIAHGGNPYDPAATLRMEQAAGRNLDKTEVTYSPPVGLVLALPLGYVTATTGYVLWSLALFASFALAVWILWLQHGSPNTLLHLLCFLFAPAVVCVLAAQLGIFFLLGVALFLYLHRTWPLLAGVVLLPCTLKPHLFVPVAVVLVLWTIHKRTYRVLLGFLLAMAASSAVMWRMDPQIWTQYLQMVKSQSVMSAVSPTLSAMLRVLISPHSAWLQFVPEMAACVWAIWYFRRWRAEWDWMDHGLLVMLVAVLCTPYGYFTDESVLLPAVLAGLYWARSTGRSLLPLFVVGGIGLLEMSQKVKLTSPYYLWSAPAWLAWYLYATRDRRVVAGPAESAAD